MHGKSLAGLIVGIDNHVVNLLYRLIEVITPIELPQSKMNLCSEEFRD